jgi:hypothetical protein
MSMRNKTEKKRGLWISKTTDKERPNQSLFLTRRKGSCFLCRDLGWNLLASEQSNLMSRDALLVSLSPK